MTQKDLMMKEFDGPNGAKKLARISEIYKQEAIEGRQLENSIMSDEKYFNWLEEFTRTRSDFQSDTYFLEYSNVEQKHVQQLGYLYKGINNYARKNGIHTTLHKRGSCYYLEHNGVYFEIGTKVGNRISYYCKRLEVVNNDCISTKDILSIAKYEPLESAKTYQKVR